MLFNLDETQVLAIFDHMLKVATKEKLLYALEVIKKILMRIEERLNELETPKVET